MQIKCDECGKYHSFLAYTVTRWYGDQPSDGDPARLCSVACLDKWAAFERLRKADDVA